MNMDNMNTEASGGIQASAFKKHLGRNSPCPCGSGKKYKKCHLGQIPQYETKEMLEKKKKAALEAKKKETEQKQKTA